MAADGGKRVARIPMNMVQMDEIWKDHVRRENVSARQRWPETWGYLVSEYRKLNCNLAGKPASSRPPTSKNAAALMDGLKLPEIPKKRPGYPQTTSQEIGWKTAQNGNNAMMVYNFGEKRCGKCTIQRRLNWPKDAC